jgi:hypothetical protein
MRCSGSASPKNARRRHRSCCTRDTSSPCERGEWAELRPPFRVASTVLSVGPGDPLADYAVRLQRAQRHDDMDQHQEGRDEPAQRCNRAAATSGCCIIIHLGLLPLANVDAGWNLAGDTMRRTSNAPDSGPRSRERWRSDQPLTNGEFDEIRCRKPCYAASMAT